MGIAGVSGAALVAALLWVGTTVAAAAPPLRAQAGLLLDLATGRVLYAKNAEVDRPPASLVKLMTLYLAYEDLAAGRVGPGDPVTVSAHAAATPRFRLGLEPGDTVPLRTLLQAVAVVSANDAAVAVAEHLEGSEAAFVSRMNATARRLGLDQTTFANPHGLPDPRQRTTARDMARLMEQLVATFPESRELLAETEFSWRGRAYLRDRIPLFHDPGGVTALKTGYTREARYNLAVAVARAGHQLLCVILGAETRGRSFLEAARLLRLGFANGQPIPPRPRRFRPRALGSGLAPR